ncbi:MAG: 4-(cytidine 5'-diphospho)-2-C-methyl-D-erythritol kinase [Phycisphaerales bacterium]
MSNSVSIHAPAKINLALSVGPPEPADTPDAGMHPIASWMTAVDLFDDFTLEKADEISLDAKFADDAPAPSPVGWLTGDDLAVRALIRLGEHTNQELNAKITIRKRIPVGGGLGGGSSDAAATLNAANRLFGLGLEPAQLQAIGRTLGSDIPFFLDEGDTPRPAIVSHFGEVIRRVELKPTKLVLIMPGFGCHTGDVYRQYDQAPLTLDAARTVMLAERGEIDTEDLFNDLTLAAQRTQPELETVLLRLGRVVDGPVHVSGSGSTLFVVTDEPDTLASEIESRVTGVRCAAVTTLTGTGSA